MKHSKLTKTARGSGRSWGGSPRKAKRQVYLREPPPVSLAWKPWFQAKFTTVAKSSDPALLTRLIYGTLWASSRGQEFPLASNQLEDFLDLGGGDKKRSRSVTPIIEQLSQALEQPYTPHSYALGLARNIQIPPDRAQQLLAEWQTFALPPEDPEASHPITGEKTRGTKFKNVLRLAKQAVRQAETAAQPEQPLHDILQHLNSRSVPEILTERTLEQIRRLEGERDQALAAPAGDQSKILGRYSYRLQALNGCLVSAMGGYIWHRASQDNYRIFARGQTLASISSEDRRAITLFQDGFVELDLASAHLAISHKLFGGQELETLLRGGQVWATLLAAAGMRPEDKDLLKPVVYAMLYGSSRLRQMSLLIRDPEGRHEVQAALDLAERKRQEGKEPGRTARYKTKIRAEIKAILKGPAKEALMAFRKLERHPAIQELLQGRRRLEEQLRGPGEVLDAFGRKQAISKKPSRTIAALASSYEKALLLPIYQAADKSTDFQVLLDQHDGCTLHFLRRDSKTRTDNILQRLQEAVEATAKELGIITKLEIKNKGSV